jgi:hypothetical protein
VLFPKQREWIDWILERWRASEPGITEKTRQMGFSWLSMSLSCTLCLFHHGMSIGVGSRKQEYVDVLGDPKSLLQKAREFMNGLPPEFRGGWDVRSHAPHMRMMFPGTESIITGESGDNIGRGNSTSMYFLDEAAFVERPQLIDAALSQTTNCRQDISTPNGMGNPFAQKRFSGHIKVFSFTWRDDPRKDDVWYEKQVRELDPVTLAQEVDVNYSASAEGVLIPSSWVQAAIGARERLRIDVTGRRYAGLDVADEGRDLNAFAGRHGIELQHLKSWSGKNSDIYATVVKAFALCEEWGYETFDYDADGLGAGVRGDARRIKEERQAVGKNAIRDEPFRGSGAVWNPEGEMVAKRLNKDYFQNAKAQAWWALRLRFEKTHRAVVEGLPYEPDDIISISPQLGELTPLTMELSQPTYSVNQVGKIVMIAYQPASRSLDLWMRLGQ